MAIIYKNYKKLIDKDIKKKDIEVRANVSRYTINKGENVTIDILEKICTTLGCSIEDIMEFVPNKDGDNKRG